MKRFLIYSGAFVFLLAALFSCEMDENPNADYQIKGTVTDSVSGNTIQGIRVVLYCSERTPTNDTLYTDSKGKYNFSFNHAPFLVPSFKLTFMDVDGAEKNGDFETRIINAQISDSDWVDEGDDYNYYGKAVKIVDVKLKQKVL